MISLVESNMVELFERSTICTWSSLSSESNRASGMLQRHRNGIPNPHLMWFARGSILILLQTCTICPPRYSSCCGVLHGKSSASLIGCMQPSEAISSPPIHTRLKDVNLSESLWWRKSSCKAKF